MTCMEPGCPQCASVVHTGTAELAPARAMPNGPPGRIMLGTNQPPICESYWENSGTYGSHYEDDGPGRGGYYYTD